MILPDLETRTLAAEVDSIAPDGSEIRLLSKVRRGSMVNCTLPAGCTSIAVKHRTIEELWYFLSGQGRMWRSFGTQEETFEVKPGMSINIPTGTRFQFQNPGSEPLCILIVSMPPWPGESEAIPQQGPWEARLPGSA
jgi:mannose-6-phosphate isomerase-like protein (cupin superfamily)